MLPEDDMGAGLRRLESLRIGESMVRRAGLECKDAVRTITGSYSNQEQISRSQLSRRFGTGWRPPYGAHTAHGVLGDHATGLVRLPIAIIHESSSNPSFKE